MKTKRQLTIRYRADQRQAEKNRAYYYAHKAELLRKYKNKYIAINDGQVVEVDKDRSQLLDRMFKKFGDQPFFFTQVTEQPRIVRIPSYALRKTREQKIPL